MKKIITVLFICALVLWIACSDDDDNGVNSNGDTTPRLVANTSVTEPTLSSPDETMWASVTGATINLNRSGAVGKAAANIALNGQMIACTCGTMPMCYTIIPP